MNLIHGALGNVLVDGMWLANTLTLDSVEFISGILYANIDPSFTESWKYHTHNLCNSLDAVISFVSAI